MAFRSKPPKGDWNYRQLWRIVDGAVASCFAAHPGYLSGEFNERVIRQSIVKRVTGSIIGYAEESAKARSVEEAAGDTGIGGTYQPSVEAALATGGRSVTARWRSWGGRESLPAIFLRAFSRKPDPTGAT